MISNNYHSSQNFLESKDSSGLHARPHEEEDKCAELKKVESANLNCPAHDSYDQRFIHEIEKDYETIVSKDLDFEETLNNMEVISISSVDNGADLEDGPNLNNKIPNDFTFANVITNKKDKDEGSANMDKNMLNGGTSPSKSPRTKKKSNPNSLIQNHPFRALIFSPYINETIFSKHLMQTYKGLVYAKKCLKVQISEYQREKSVNLKEKKGTYLYFNVNKFAHVKETAIKHCSWTWMKLWFTLARSRKTRNT